MAYKLTMIFQCTTDPEGTGAVPRTAGWTESVYNSTLTTGVRNQFRDLMVARAGLLPREAAIVGQRYQVVLPTGGSSTGGQRFNGSAPAAGSGRQTDVPSTSLLCKTLTQDLNTRNTIIRCIPDEWVRGGELLTSSFITTALQSYFTELTGWDMLGRQLDAAQIPIFAITDAGLVSFFENTAVSVPGKVRISSSVDEDGIRRGGVFKALSQPTASSVLLENWNYPATKGGTLRAQPIGLHTITTSSVSRVITKKVGRPLFVFLGRRSKKRR